MLSPDKSLQAVPFDAEPSTGIEGGLAKLAFAIFVGLAALILATVSALIGLVRKEKKTLSLVALIVAGPALLLLIFGVS